MDKMTKPNEAPSTDSAWIESRDERIEREIHRQRNCVYQLSKNELMYEFANFGYNYRGQIEAKRVEVLVKSVQHVLGMAARMGILKKTESLGGFGELLMNLETELTQFRNGAVNEKTS